MKKYIKKFILNGLFVCGLGPVVLAIVYAALNAAGVVEVIEVEKVILEIISVTVLTFIAGGINIVYKIEKLPLILAIFIHALVLYLDYIVIYLMNGWLKEGVLPLVIFTCCFAFGFALIWIIVYLTTKSSADKINRKLESVQNASET